MKVTVIIITWNKLQLLKECLKSLKKQSFKPIQIIVVDNGSTDGTLEFLHHQYSQIKIISFQKNLGFSKAANEGIKASGTEYLILLNNDTVVDKDFIKYLVVALDKHKDSCGVTARIINFFDKNILASAGDAMNDTGQAFSRGLGDNINNWNKSDEVFLITGGASIFRKKSFRKIGYFDEDYFFSGEDSDWCFRAQLAGYKFWYEPKALVSHHHKATSKNLSKRINYFHFRNMTITIMKNFPWGLFFKKWRFITIPLIHLNTIIYLTFKGYLKEALLADFWIISHLAQIIKKRRLIQSNRKVSVNYINEWLQPKRMRFYGLLK